MLKKEILFWYLSQLVTLIWGLFFLIFIPKFSWVEVYWKFMLILSYISLFWIFMWVPIQEAIKKELIESKLNEIWKKYIFNWYLLRIIINILFFIVFYFFYKYINWLNKISYLLLLFIFLFINISWLPQNIFLSLHQNKNNFYFVLIEYFLQIWIILWIYFYKWFLNIDDILIAFIMWYSIPTVLFSLYIFIKNSIWFNFDKKIIKILLSRYFLLSLSSISFLLLTNIDNIMISYFFSDKELWFYNIATWIVNKTTIFSIAIVTSILPLFNLKEKKEKIKVVFKKYLKILLWLNLLVSLSIFLLSWFWIKLIYWNWYGLSIKIMQIICLFPLFAILQTFFSWILVNFWKYKELMYISFFIAILNIVLNYILLNIFWIYWVSIATIISYFLWSLILFFIIYKSII